MNEKEKRLISIVMKPLQFSFRRTFSIFLKLKYGTCFYTPANLRYIVFEAFELTNNIYKTIEFSSIIHFLTFSTTQVSPSSSPSWVFAEQAVIVHLRFFISSMFSYFRICIVFSVLRRAEEPARDLACWRILAKALLIALFPNLLISNTTKSFYS